MSRPVQIAMGLIGTVGLIVWAIDPDLGFVFWVLLMPVGTYAIWDQQRVGYFTREDAPYLFWFFVTLGCAMSFILVWFVVTRFVFAP